MSRVCTVAVSYCTKKVAHQSVSQKKRFVIISEGKQLLNLGFKPAKKQKWEKFPEGKKVMMINKNLPGLCNIVIILVAVTDGVLDNLVLG